MFLCFLKKKKKVLHKHDAGEHDAVLSSGLLDWFYK